VTLREAGPVAVGAGEAVVDVDPGRVDAEGGEGVALGGEVLGVGGDPGVANQHDRPLAVPVSPQSPVHIIEPLLRHTSLSAERHAGGGLVGVPLGGRLAAPPPALNCDEFRRRLWSYLA